MIQDIAPKKLYNEYTPQSPGKNDYIVLFQKNKILIKETGGCIALPKTDELQTVLRQPAADAGSGIYLFRIEEEHYFLYPDFGLPEDCMVSGKEEYRLIKISEIRYLAGHEICYAAYTAYHLYQWYRNHRFCGCCGNRMKPDTKERMLYCAKCGSQIYPVISPAVIVAVTNGSKILLSKYANREYKRYALIAGYAEIGETAEEAVRREVMEEVGLRVKNIRYYKSQPWGIDGNLLFGYFAELDGDDTLCVDQEELAEAEWVERECLKDMDDSVSLTREMMGEFYKSR